MFRFTNAAIGLALVATAGCSTRNAETAPVTEATAQSGTQSSVRRNANTITSQELAESGSQNLYQAVQTLRPQWLRARPRTSIATGSATGGASAVDQTVVYLDQNKFGGLQSLQQLTLGGVQEIRFYDGVEATNRFGTGHSAGAIVVRTAR